MDQLYLLEVILDNLPDGVYVLDDRGNYIFVNSAYVQALNMPKDVLLHYNVHDLPEHRADRHLCLGYRLPGEAPGGHVSGRAGHPKLWPGHHPPDDHSTPIFDDSGKIRNILAVVRPLDRLNQLYYQATQAESVSSISGLRLRRR